jgi:hypothetical protein
MKGGGDEMMKDGANCQRFEVENVGRELRGWRWTLITQFHAREKERDA